ncbi:MAG: hypothetical protein ACRD9R_05720 [Pyrinomonadaceae bacterium]
MHTATDSISTRSALVRRAFILVACALALSASAVIARAQKVVSQSNAPAAAVTPALTRTATRREVRRFGYGGTLSVYGAPAGSLTVEAWSRSEIEITAELEWRADTEEELAQLAAVNNFILDEGNTHFSVITTGTHDRTFMKRVAKKFPKKLLAMPWRIDYRLRVPAAIDVDVFAGSGALKLDGIEGAIRLHAGDASPTELTLTGGDLSVTVAGGPLRLRVPARNWRGRGATVRLLRGDITVELPTDFNADVDASVLRAGRVENQHPRLAPRERTTPTEHSLQARAGGGGPTLSFEVGDGNIRIVTSDK